MLHNTFKVAYLVAIYFLLSNILFAQDNWTWLNPKPMGSTIQSNGYFPGTNTIVAVGAGGLIMRSTDNGTSWNHIQSNTTSGFYSVSIVNSTLAYVAGENAAILKSTDAGQSWSAISTSNISATISQLQFISESVAFARVGDIIYRSTNSGADWSAIVTNSDGLLTTFCAISETKLFFGTKSGAYYSASQSGGWDPSTISVFSDDPYVRQVQTIVANGSNIVIFSNYEHLTVSTDSGNTWTLVTMTGTGLAYSCASFISGVRIVAVASGGILISSSDCGLNWSAPYSETPAGATTVSSNQLGKVIILGVNGLQYTSLNAGESWSKSSETITSTQLNSVCSIDGTTIWAAGNNRTVIKSTDGGLTWAKKTTSFSENINDIKFVSPTTGYFVAGNKLYKSLDAGDTWSVHRIFSNALNEISAWDAQNIIIAANVKKVYSTTNAGTSWDSTSLGSSGDHFSAYYLNSTTALVGGTTGMIYRTTNNGKTWLTGTSATGNLNSIWFSTPTTGWAAGYKPVSGNPGVLLKTTDAGSSWNLVSDTLNSNLQSVRFSDSQNGLTVGNLGFILKTTDGGTIWRKTSQVTDNNLFCATLIDGSTTFIAGSNGTILKSSNAPLPVELTSFTATHKNGTVTLNWETKTEIDNYGFEIERKSSTANWQKIGFVEGHFTTNSPKYYNYTDRPKGTGKLQYRLKQIDNDGTFEYSPVVEVLVGSLPNGYLLEQNYPNPFNPSTSIGFTTQTTGFVKLVVYNPLGETVKVLFSDIAEAGRYYKLEFDATGLPSGVYFYQLEAENFKSPKKMTLIK